MRPGDPFLLSLKTGTVPGDRTELGVVLGRPLRHDATAPVALAAAIRSFESELDGAVSDNLGADRRSGSMNYKGIEYKIRMVRPGIWKYRFQIGRGIKTGTLKVEHELLAMQRVRRRINRELKIVGSYETA